MARVIYGNEEAFDIVAFGRPDVNTVQFLAAHNSTVSQNYSKQAAAFVSSLSPVFDMVDYDKLNNLAHQLSDKAATLISTNTALPLVILEAIQQADLFNQRFIMACPEIRAMYHANQCNGFSDTYVDASPNDIGFGHYDYRRATDQLMIMSDDGWESTTYFDDLQPGDRHLVLGEKEDIQLTWEAARYFIKHAKKDPTSRDDDPL